MDTQGFIGNQKSVHYLSRISDKGRVSHAYLFTGPEGVGKATLALIFAAGLLGDTAGNLDKNPDLIRIRVPEGEKQIGIEAVREMQKSLSLYPFKAKHKVAIIEQAELLSPSAANSLLKTLEEPNETSVIILIAADAGKILPTINSRCQCLSFNPVYGQEIDSLLRSRGVSAAGDIADLAQGRPGLAIRLADDPDLLGRMKQDKKTVLGLFDMGNFEKLESASAVYDLEKEEAVEVLDGWIVALRAELLKGFEKGEGKRVKEMKEAIEKTITVREDIIERNVNLKLSIENLVLSFK